LIFFLGKERHVVQPCLGSQALRRGHKNSLALWRRYTTGKHDNPK